MRVPIEQAEQMYTALKKRSVPARFIGIPRRITAAGLPGTRFTGRRRSCRGGTSG